MLLEEMFEKYGAELVSRELEVEAKFKFMGQEASRREYEFAKTDENGGVLQTQLGQKFLGHEFVNVQNGIKVFFETCLKPHRGTKPAYTLIVSDIYDLYDEDEKLELYGVITLSVFSTLLNGVMRKECQHSNLCQIIAKELFDEVKLKAYLNVSMKKESVLKGIEERVRGLYRRSYALARMGHENFTYNTWNREDSLQLAASLIQVVLATSNYFEEVLRNNLLEIQPSQFLLDAWQKNEDKIIDNAYRLCPTVLPPRDWENYFEGGYYGELRPTSKLLRLHRQQDVFAKNYMSMLNQLELAEVRKAINAIQATPWKINTRVLDVLQVLVKRGGGVAGVPTLEQGEPPSVLPEEYTEEQLAKHKKRLAGWYRSETRRKSLCLRAISALRTAEEFRNDKAIYFPCNMDFRGRVYPIPSFSFQGDDVNKSLIEFANPPQVENTATAYKWLLVQGANLAGVDKVSFDDRIAWVKEHHEQIMSCASEPLGDLWWSLQDSPCQFLAWVFEYQRAMEYMSNNNNSLKGFLTGMNVAFDGTCSGLQHFSAILRDPIGGEAVNLIPTDKPSDIYGIVAGKVNEVLKEDARTGTLDEMLTTKDGNSYKKYGTRTLAQQWLAFEVTRKVTKRSVMTLAYGSKEYGFRDQVHIDTIQPDIDEKGELSIFAETNYQAAGYMAKLIWGAVGTTVVKAVEGMKWLQDCARLVTKSKQVVSWGTPAGLLIQQSYMTTSSKSFMVRCAGKRIRLYNNALSGDIDKRSQASGIAPNFIHSMDACHLQLTVCACVDKGINHFSMIHDSYGAPLAQAQVMFDTVRESFVKMYTDNDVLDQFRADMSLLTTTNLPRPPKQGTLDLNLVLKSDYIFS